MVASAKTKAQQAACGRLRKVTLRIAQINFIRRTHAHPIRVAGELKMDQSSPSAKTLIALTPDILAANVSNNGVAVDEVPTLIQKVYGTLAWPAVPEKLEPAVSIRSSMKNDHIVYLEDDKKMKMLRRRLLNDHGLTPAGIALAGAWRPTTRWSRPIMPSGAACWPRKAASAASPAKGAPRKSGYASDCPPAQPARRCEFTWRQSTKSGGLSAPPTPTR